MLLKGFDKFREKTPMLNGIRILIVPIYLCIVIWIASYVLNVIILYPESFSVKLAGFVILYFPIIGFLVIEIICFLLLSQMWLWRDKLKNKWGSLSYQRILPIGLSGITIIIFLAFYNFNHLPNYSNPISQTDFSYFLSQPFYSFFKSPWKNYFYASQLLIGFIMLLLGLSLSFRSIQTFGIDYTTAVYLYFPEESSVQENQIYSVLRHPMYSGLLFISLGGFIFNLTVYSLINFVLYSFGFYIHIHFIEEKELISRFGESYIRYRKEVPPFFINPTKFFRLLTFIIRG